MRKFLILFLILPFFSLSAQDFYLGVDLSYTNEMEDCEVVYYENNVAGDPFTILSNKGANLARFRLWHTPDWTNYSTLEDVKISIGRAKAAGMSVLLDFHYSDTWADPGHQLRPAAWNDITDFTLLGDSLYNYTFAVLESLNNDGLAPDMVQIGNETNGNILLKPGEALYPITWGRNVNLFTRALEAVAHFNALSGTDVKTVIHIAQPESALWWFQDAKANGLTNFDIIGISYYPGWSEMGIWKAANAIGELIATHQKEVIVVEIAYPWTLEWADNASNNMGAGNLLKSFGSVASPGAQYEFLSEFTWLVKETGGSGVFYWEPGWVSSDCYTPWGQGSHWENVTLFDFDYNLHQGAAYLGYDYSQKPPALEPVEVTFKVDMTGVDVSNGVFVTGDFTGLNWQFMHMELVGDNIYAYTTQIPGRSSGAYIFQNKADWGEQWRETVPVECALFWNSHREFVIEKEAAQFGFVWGTCTAVSETGVGELDPASIHIAPNPASNLVFIQSENRISSIEILNILGETNKNITFPGLREMQIDISDLDSGIYFIKMITYNNLFLTKKFVKR